MPATIENALQRIDNHSPFLRRLAERHSDIPEIVAKGGMEALIDALPQAHVSLGDVSSFLRVARQRVAYGMALADLSGALPLETVVGALSRFADYALDCAIKTALQERYPDAEPVGFAALALGKHGSSELNYSSDIDPILIFDPETLPHNQREEPVEAAARISRRVVELLQARDGDGYVFRVDLRLRPSPEATPPALPIEAAIGYYESSALPWERAAFIRSRACAGDIALGQQFLSAIRPFIWRRTLDYGAIFEIRSISRRIRSHHSQGQAFGLGYDLKRGRGGIRECEFFAQIHQLIYGGREPALRAPATLDALAALSAAQRIEPEAAVVLSDAYRLYRTIEHRLQMVEDQQTHSLPRDPAALDNVARLHGLEDGAALLDTLAPHITAVGSLYDALDDADADRASVDVRELGTQLRKAGFQDSDAAVQRIEGWRSGKARSLRTAAAREALEAMLPSLIAQFGKAPDPNAAVARFDDLILGLPTAINLFRLIQARPALGRMLDDILSHAPPLAAALARRAALLDGLISHSALEPAPSVDALVEAFAETEAGDDYQMLLERVRQRVGESRFALGVQIVEGASDPITVAEGYARVAEAAIRVLTKATTEEFERDHGQVPGGELVILGLGRLGGGALTHASDLDLIYLFTGDYRSESNGRRPTGATIYFNRLAQRVTAALTVPTAAGALYEVDTRLRPSGNQGPLAASVESFAQYQRESAWTWEHMALTRARVVYGSPVARAEVEAIINDTLNAPRDVEKLTTDAVTMRGEVTKHKPPASPFDVKLVEGGLVDCEFAVHVLQLRHHKAFDTRLRRAAKILADEGLLDPGVEPAHALLTRMLVTQRLISPQSTEPPEESKALVARACGQADWPTLVTALEAARALISAEWKRVGSL